MGKILQPIISLVLIWSNDLFTILFHSLTSLSLHLSLPHCSFVSHSLTNSPSISLSLAVFPFISLPLTVFPPHRLSLTASPSPLLRLILIHRLSLTIASSHTRSPSLPSSHFPSLSLSLSPSFTLDDCDCYCYVDGVITLELHEGVQCCDCGSQLPRSVRSVQQTQNYRQDKSQPELGY